MQRTRRRTSKLFIFFAVIVCLTVLSGVTAFADDGEDVPVVVPEAVADCAPVVAEAYESAPAAVEEVSEAEPAAVEETSEPAPESAEEVSEPAPEAEEEIPEAAAEPAPAEEEEIPAPEEEESAPAEEAPVEGGSAEQPVIPGPAEPAAVPEDISSAELKGEPVDVTPIAQFTAADGHKESIAVGESADIIELVSLLGYEGEIESVSSSNPDAFEVVDGQLIIKQAFLDETLTVIIGGQEIVIPVHDPDTATFDVEDENGLYNAFKKQDSYSDIVIKLKDSIEVNNGKLIVNSGKTVTLDLQKCVISGKEGSTGSVITVLGGGTFVLRSPVVITDGDEADTGSVRGGNADKGGGVNIESGGRFTMEGGVIEENKARYGGGVYVAEGSSFTMKGGYISKNEASSSGGGVYQNGTMAVTGSSKILDNTEGTESTASNIFLPVGKTVAVSGTLTKKDPFGSFGILSEEKPHFDTSGEPVPVTVVTGAKEENLDYFNSDDKNFKPVFNSDSLQLIPVGKPVAELDDGSKYLNVQNAIDAANDTYKTVTMLADSEECISIVAGKEVILNLSGHTLSGGGNGSVITVTGSLKLNDSSEEKSGTVTGGEAGIGGGVYVEETGTFTMESGIINENSALYGGGVYNAGSFTMNGGVISSNDAAVFGGGVFNAGRFTMSGGSITENKAGENGGGVYVNNGMTVSGSASVTENTLNSDSSDNNIYLVKDQLITIGETGLNDAEFGVMTEVKPDTDSDKLQITGGGNSEQKYAEFFKSDDTVYSVVFDESSKNLYLQAKTPTDRVALLHDGSGKGIVFESVQKAVDEANERRRYITLLKDKEENITIAGGKDVLLNLNGHVLKGEAEGGSVITISSQGSLTLSDGSNDKSGKITGGKAENGGGVNVMAGGKFTMNSGEISSNTATSLGGGVYTDGETTINGGQIINNIGGGVYLTGGNLTLSGSALVMYNKSNSTDPDQVSTQNIVLGQKGVHEEGNCLINVGTLEESARFGVSVQEWAPSFTPVQISTSPAKESDARHFTADYPDCGVEFKKEGNYLQLRSFDIVAMLDDGSVYESVQAAIDAADDTYHKVTLLIDRTENIGIPNGKTVTLDLNGYTLKGDGKNSVITVKPYANFTLENGISSSVSKITGGGAKEGGGVWVGNHAKFILKNVTICLNRAEMGGGVYLSNDSVMNIEGGVIRDNDARSGSGLGGGIYGYTGARVTMNAGEISGNKAISGGGVFLANESNFIMSGGSIVKNQANSWGGGIDASADSKIQILDGKIIGNEAANGGGIHGHTGSIIYFNGGDISDNTATQNGGGINGDTVTMNGGIITGNSAAKGGGGVNAKFLSMYGGEISKNTARSEDFAFLSGGGGVFIKTGGEFYLKYGEITGNIAKTNGGGVCTDSSSLFTMEGGTITGNEVGENGGGCFVCGTFEMHGGEISKNKAIYSYGGGLYVEGRRGGKAGMNGGSITGNEAQYGGGAVIRYGGELTMAGGEISGNTAYVDGGGVYIHESHADADPNSNIKVTYAVFDMNGGTVSSNKAYRNGGGVFDWSKFILHGRAEITGNTAGANGGGVYLNNTKYSDMTVSEQPRVIGNSLTSGEINNVYLPGNYSYKDYYIKRISISRLTDGAYIGITTQLKPNLQPNNYPVLFTANNTAKKTYVSYFNSDDPAYHVEFFENGWVSEYESKASNILVLKKGAATDGVAQLNDPNKTKYPSVQAAVEASTEDYNVITMLKDSKENVVIDGKTVTLDLDGHSLTGGWIAYESVITLSGKADFTLVDSSLESVGSISDGHDPNGGGVSVTEGSKFYMAGGKITGCEAALGGAVYVDEDSSFIFAGGLISGNKAEGGKGGGVYNAGKFEFIGRNNKIEENNADYGGGVYNSSTGTFEMRSYDDEVPDEIRENTAFMGGGVFNEGTFIFSGGKISGNTAEKSGGGVYQNGKMEVTLGFSRDSAVIVDGNKDTDSANNIYLTDGKIINVVILDDLISSDNKLGVTTQKDPSFSANPKIPFAEAESDVKAEKANKYFSSDGAFEKIREDETLYLSAAFEVFYVDGESHYGDGISTEGTIYAFVPEGAGSINKDEIELIWQGTAPEGITFTIEDGLLILWPCAYNGGDSEYSDVGEYKFSATVKGISSENTAMFKVLPREVTVIADDNFKYYGNDDPTVFTATVKNALKGEEVTIRYKVSRESGEAVGTYAIIPTGDADQGNYHVNFENGTFKIIEPEQLIVIGYDCETAYDGEYHGQAAWTSITEGVTVVYSFDDGKTWQADVPQIKDVGERFITVKAEKGTEGEKGYQKAEDTYTLKITPKEIRVAWIGSDFTYNGDEQAPTAEVIGVVKDEDVTICVEGSGIDAGDYTATAYLEGEDAGNYIFANDVRPEHDFTINPREITVKWSDDEFTYDGEEHSPTAEAIGVLSGETVNITIDGSGIDAGEYTALATGLYGEDCHNYEFSDDAELTHDFTINPKAVTVTADSKSKVVGDDDPELTATVKGTIGEDTVEYSLTREAGEGIGTYTIMAYGAELQGNYEVSFEFGTFEITDSNVLRVSGTDYDGVYDAEEHGEAAKASKEGSEIFYSIDGGETWTDKFPTIVNAGSILVIVRAENGNEIATGSYILNVNPKTVTVTAQNNGKEFGDEDPELKATVEGTLGDDTVEYTLWRESGEAVGTYVIYAGGDEIQGNYELSFIPGEFTITPSDELRVVGIDYCGEYDALEHGEAAKANITEGTLIYYSTDGGASWSAEFPTIINVGEISVTVKAENPNYSTATDTYSLVVIPKEVTVTADDGKKIYGSDDPALTATEEGLIGTDRLLYTITRETGENAGSYVITVSGDALQGNYAVTYVNGTFTIEPKAVIVRAEDNYKVKGEADPVLTASVTGLIDGDEIIYHLEREAGEELGSYVITASGDEMQGNYSVSYVNGTFEIIEKGKLIVIGYDYTGDYDGEYHGTAAKTNITEGVRVSYSLDEGKTWQTEFPTIKNVDECFITVKAEMGTKGEPGYQKDEDYYILTVTPKEITVEWTGDEFIYNGEIQAPTAEVIGAVEGETVSVDVEGYGINTGVYTARAAGLSSTNYMFAFGEMPEHIFRILPKEVTVKWSDDDAFTYDGEEHAPTAKVEGAVEGETVTVNVSGAQINASDEPYTAIASYLSDPNYTFAPDAELTHEFTIARKAVTVTADSKSKVVGEADPELTATVEGTLGGDTVEYTLWRETGEAVGIYKINVTGEKLQGNYIVSLINGDFEIIEKVKPAEEVHPRYVFEKTAYSSLTGSGAFEAKLIYTGYGSPATEDELQYLILKIDGIEVSPENFTLTLLSNGDIVIEFTAEFIESLAKGEHTLEFDLRGCYGRAALTIE